MTINCNAVADRSVKSSPYLSLKTFVLLLTLCLGFVATAQDDTYEGGNLDEVTVTEDEARSLIKQLIDVDRFLHSFGVQKIAKDEALVAYAEGFVERNSIEVLTIGYIDSEEFWPRIFKNIRLKKIDKANTDLLLTGHIMFIPIMGTDGSISGYTVELKLEGKTTQVYELLEVSQTDIELIAEETTTKKLGDKTYTTPAGAQREVANAMIAALQRVEGKGDTTDQNIQLVSFQASSKQDYGFDSPQHTQLNNDYPTVTIGGSSSRTSWKSLISNSTDQVIAISAGDQDLTFELDGAPVTATAGDNNSYNLTLMGSSDGVTGELLAKVGTATAGKLNTISYDISTATVKVVPINGAGSGITQPALQQALNDTYAPAVASWNVEVMANQNLGTDWDDEDNGLEDGETGMLSNYTKEMNDLIKAFKDKNDRDKDAYYVFLVKTAENARKKGYMPRKKQWGFVFTDSHSGVEDIITTIAHELGHGVYRLEHTFSEKGIPKGQSKNLMDYANGRDLYKYQWDFVHNPASVITLFDDEEEAAYEVSDLLALNIQSSVDDPTAFFAKYTFITPAGGAITLPNEVTKLRFNRNTMQLYEFELNDVRYVTAGSKDATGFLGYVPVSVITASGYKEGDILTEEFKNAILESRYSLQTSTGRKAYGLRQELIGEQVYAVCYCSYEWDAVPYAELYGAFKNSRALPDGALIGSCTGEECDELNQITQGLGTDFYAYIKKSKENQNDPLNDTEKESVKNLANHLDSLLQDRTFAFYGYSLEAYGSDKVINSGIKDYFVTNEIFSVADFKNKFPYLSDSRDKNVIVSSEDLWAGIDRNSYNINTINFIENGIYEYSNADLKTRQHYKELGGLIYQTIKDMESQGLATPLSQNDVYDQYVACFGTNSAIYAWTSFFANTMTDVVEIGVAYEAVRATTAFLKATKVAKKGWLKKIVDYFRKYIDLTVVDNLITKIDNLNLKTLATSFKTSDNLIIKKTDDVTEQLSIHGFHDNDFKELATIKDNVLTIKQPGVLDEGASVVNVEKVADDIEIRGANGENLNGRVEMVTDDSGRSWFRVTSNTNTLAHLNLSDLDNLLEVTTTVRSGGVRAINNVKNLVNEGKALVIKPIENSSLAGRVDDYIAAYTAGNSKLQGEIGEEISEMLAREIDSGPVLNIKVNESGHGFDAMLFETDLDNPTAIKAFESKPLSGTSVELPGTNNGTQMSGQWKTAKINEMLQSTDEEVRRLGQILDDNEDLIEGYVMTIDKDLKQVIFLKLDNF